MKRRAARIHLPVLAQDALLGLFVAAMQVQGSVAKPPDVGSRPLTDFGHLGYVLLTVSGLVLALRRRWPVPVFSTAALASLVYYAAGFADGPGWIGLFVALYTLTAYGDGRRSLAIVGVGITVLTTGWLISAADIEPRAAIGWVFFRIAASVMAAALGESVRSRRVIAAEALERARRAERTREEEARSRVDAERQTSAQALHEMRAVLGVLRDSDNGRAPHPGLGQVNELTAMAREAGLDIKLQVTPPTAALPSAVDHTAYRILQESITNVIRHVGPTRVMVALDYRTDVLEVRVSDEGGRDAPGDDAAGSKSKRACRWLRPKRCTDERGGRFVVRRSRCCSPTIKFWCGPGSRCCSTPKKTSRWWGRPLTVPRP